MYNIVLDTQYLRDSIIMESITLIIALLNFRLELNNNNTDNVKKKSKRVNLPF